MVVLKGMGLQTDCQKCPLMATDGTDTLSPMMCMALWATKHEVKHCIQGKILDDCPLVEIVTCKDCFYYNIDEDGRGYHCEKYGHTRFPVYADFYCADAERRE